MEFLQKKKKQNKAVPQNITTSIKKSAPQTTIIKKNKPQTTLNNEIHTLTKGRNLKLNLHLIVIFNFLLFI
jgi:hypothetical protein